MIDPAILVAIITLWRTPHSRGHQNTCTANDRTGVTGDAPRSSREVCRCCCCWCSLRWPRRCSRSRANALLALSCCRRPPLPVLRNEPRGEGCRIGAGLGMGWPAWRSWVGVGCWLQGVCHEITGVAEEVGDTAESAALHSMEASLRVALGGVVNDGDCVGLVAVLWRMSCARARRVLVWPGKPTGHAGCGRREKREA